MKSLILILLVGITAQAQTLADLARQERARQAKLQGSRVITNDDLKRSLTVTAEPQAAPQTAPAPPAEKQEPAAPAEPSKPVETPKPAAATEPDPVKAWNDEIAELRRQVRELQDRETATQLQINDLTNRVYAPVTSVRERNEAQGVLGAAQRNLTTIRDQIVATRVKLEQLQARGPAKK